MNVPPGNFIFFCLLCLMIAGCEKYQAPSNCQPTPFDEIGPFYRPGAPVRSKVGSGFVLHGKVLSTDHCQALSGSRIEFWLVNEQGEYADSHRATVYADRKGRYRFESSKPTDYVGRLPHIHMMITADGHEQLITQYYPQPGETKVLFNLVLEPLNMRD